MTGVISPTNDRLFEVIMNGPKDSLYEGKSAYILGGKFKILVFLPENFPIVPPKLKFMTKIYHPNIDFFGRICLDKLKQTQGGWAPIINIPSLLISLQVLCKIISSHYYPHRTMKIH